MYWTGKSLNNLLSYCGLVDVRINVSDKDLSVINYLGQTFPDDSGSPDRSQYQSQPGQKRRRIQQMESDSD